MRFFFGVYTIDTDQLVADWSSRVTACVVRTGAHGDESLEADLDVPFLEVFYFYQQLGPLKVRCSWGGSQSVFTGRIEDPTQLIDQDTGLKIVALGYWVALSDIPIVALWSIALTKDWQIVTSDLITSCISERFEFINQNQLTISPKKNSNQANTVFGAWYFQIPDQGTRNINGIALDFSIVATDVNWLFDINSYAAGFASGASLSSIASINGTVAGCINLTLATARPIIVIFFYSNTARSPFTGEDGSVKLRITNVRLTTTVTNRLATSLTAARAAGTNVTATVGSTTGMYVGQKLQIAPNGTTGETVTVLSIGSSTQFNATFVKSYIIGDAIRALLVYPNEIIADCVATVNAINSTQINSTTALQNQTVDIDNADYQDVYANDIINDLVARGDNQSPPRQWVAQVFGDQVLRVQPRGSGRAWYVDIDSLEVVRTLTQLFNSVYVVYRDGDDRKLRSAASTDSASIVRYKITRRKAVQSEATTAILATTQRDMILAAQADPVPRASISVSRIFDQYGVEWPLWFIKADDTVTLRNLPVTLATIYDKLRTLIVARTTYDTLESGEYPLTLELEVSMPNVDVQLANALKG